MEIPELNVKGKRAIVTGTGRGIGKGLAIGLAKAGADVVVTEQPRFLAGAEETAKEIRSLGQRAIVSPLDVTQKSSIDEMVKLALKELGQIDILVNNAGINVPKASFDVTEEDWDRVLAVNLKGMFFCSQAVGKEMARTGGGAIVNLASQFGLVAAPERAIYCASKGGVANLTKALAVEWAKHNIRVNAIAPTTVLTPVIMRMLEDKDYYEETIRRIPIGRPANVEDMVGAVVFLASPAAAMVTGHILAVDGGYMAL